MPNARQRKRTRTGMRPAGHAPRFGTRPSVVQPAAPVIDVNAELTDAQWDAFLVASGNVHRNDINEHINFQQTGRRSSRLPYDVKER